MGNRAVRLGVMRQEQNRWLRRYPKMIPMQPRLSRRAAIKTTGSLGIGIATGGILTTTAAASEKFEGELNTARHTIDKYRRIEKARQNGYSFFGIEAFVGVIFANFDNVGNTKHAEDPSLLFYAPKADSDLTTDSEEAEITDENTELAGIEYHVPGRRDPPDQDIFSDEESSREFKVSEADGWHKNPEGANITGLHVWTHLENSNGLFALAHATIQERLTD